jgi:hypothetical protein
MKVGFWLLFILTLLPGQSSAQTFSGRVIDLISKKPIAHATVKSRSSTSTDQTGSFSLFDAQAGDTVQILHLSYKAYVFTFNESHPGLKAGPPPEFALQPNSFLLEEVLVKSSGAHRPDSLRNRKAFASEFAYQTPALRDIFVMKSPEESMVRHLDVHRGNNSYSASSVLKIDILKTVSLLSGKTRSRSKLQTALLADEEMNYLKSRFSEDRVIQLTRLQGDSLLTFMERYKPSAAQAKLMTDYQMATYIRKKYIDFRRGDVP